MNSRIISDISDFIFVADTPKMVDAIFLPGGSHPTQPEYAAELARCGNQFVGDIKEYLL